MQIKNETKLPTDAEILRGWLESIPFGQYNKVRSKLLEACLISPDTLRNWRYGACRIPMSGKRDINTVALEVSGYEIFTIVKPGVKSEGVSGNTSGETI